MAERPVLVIHGVNNRDKEKFTEQVEQLGEELQARDGGPWRLYPVYWGDLGAKDEYIERTLGVIPERENELDWYLRKRFESSTSDAELADPAWAARTAHARELFLAKARSRPEELDPNDAVAAAAIQRAWPRLIALRAADDSVVSTAAVAFREALAETEVAGVVEGAEDFEDRVTRAIATLFGVDRGAASLLREARVKLLPAVFRFAGDVMVYNAHAQQPAPRTPPLIQDCVIEQLQLARAHARDDTLGTTHHPISVIAHSLGALVMFDLTTHHAEEFIIDTMVSFGTQVSTLHLVHKRPWVELYGKNPDNPKTPLRATDVRRWVNLWHPLDWLAYVMGEVFTGADDGSGAKTEITDVRLPFDGRLDLMDIHSSYWTDDHAIDLMAAALRGDPVS